MYLYDGRKDVRLEPIQASVERGGRSPVHHRSHHRANKTTINASVTVTVCVCQTQGSAFGLFNVHTKHSL